MWIGSVLADPENNNLSTGRLIQNERKNRVNNDAKGSFSGGGKKNAIAFCKVSYTICYLFIVQIATGLLPSTNTIIVSLENI